MSYQNQSEQDSNVQPHNPYVQQSSNPYDQPGQQYPVQQYAPQPMPYGYYPVLPEHPSATTVLILGILSMVLGGITGPFAWVMGSKARREVRENPGTYREGGTLTVGWVLGIVGTCYLALMVVFVIIYVVVIAAMFASMQ